MSQLSRAEMSEGILMTATDDLVPILRIILALWVFWPAADVKR
jgi:hypothetical protein